MSTLTPSTMTVTTPQHNHSMLRVKIQYNHDGPKRLLRFDPSIDFEALLRKIVAKLDVITGKDNDLIQEVYQLTLEGDAEVQEVSEIEHGDTLVLIPKLSRPVKKEPTENVDDDDDDDDSVQDATEEMLQKKEAKKREETIALSSDSDSEEDDNSEDEEEVNDQESAWEASSSEEESDDDSQDSDFDAEEEGIMAAAKKQQKRRPPPESPLQVLMDEKDVPAAPGKPSERDDTNNGGLEEASTLVDGAGKNKADRAVKDRIIKLLNTGFHSESNEHEARNAMKLAQRLMRKHNLSQAILLKEREAKNNNSGSNDEVLKGGMVKVQIVNRKTRKPAQYARWISNLCSPVAKNFGVKVYNQVRRGHRCTVVFYGIYTNAQLAGYAFRVATERIAQMTAEYTPNNNKQGTTTNIGTKSARLSYALGIVNGISEEVNRNLQLEDERRQRKLDRARLAVSTGEAYEESDDEDDEGEALDDSEHDNDGPSFSFPRSAAQRHDGAPTHQDDEEESNGESTTAKESSDADGDASKNLKQPATVTGDDLNNRLHQLEQEEQAAIVLVDHGEKVAEDVLKEHEIKLRTGRKRKAINFDRKSFRKGIEDSKEIDINQRALRDKTRVKKEKRER
ncbi:expressed unknown protein [Seminavis robusta]|uniref:DUF2786 domain-containing protein n=1 Tax=Seminavis robusta TaxID=568900 RepID=A0A9N8DKH6_9STRA|nr:expressed unknown protein [Seminavis robusta]|eukprot:Sro178_g078100.1 n/a (622) ;mRNA; r:30296-32161